MPRRSSNRMEGKHLFMSIWALVLGFVILSNAIWPYVNWGVFVGAIFAITGFLKLVIPHSH